MGEADKVEYYVPSYNSNWNIYDCFYSDSGQLVIICPGEIRPPPRIWFVNSSPTNDDIEFQSYICPAYHTYVYKLPANQIDNLFRTTDQLIIIKIIVQTNQITLDSCKLPGTEQIISIRPNRYPSLVNQVVMTTMVKNENNIIRTWIDFHSGLGVHKFIIYDNQESLETADDKYIHNQHLDPSVFQKRPKLVDILADYIESGRVIIINWPYTKYLKVSGISGQTTQQNHTIHAFETVDWLGLFDVDEYINIQRPDIIFGAAGDSGIRRFLDGIARQTPYGKKRIGGIQFKNKFFYNPDDLPIEDGQFLRITNSAYGIKKRGNEKNFVIPRNINTFAVHLISSGSKIIGLHKQLGYFNHYIYLNKPSRGRDLTPWRDDSITRYLSNPINQ